MTAPVTWDEVWANLAALDGDDWDAEHDRLVPLWKDAYRSAFIVYACFYRRGGWTRENATVWADEIVDEALIEHGGNPVAAACLDVVRCEQESE
jgi:predicted N-acyltransferase